MAKISVFGIGYVGVVSAACLARDGHDVIAVDIDPFRVQALNNCLSPIVENGLDELISETVENGRLKATTDAKQAVMDTEASFICVGTPSEPDGSVGLKYVTAVCDDIGNAIRDKSEYHSVSVRSTIVPGTMEQICIPTLEAASDLIAGLDFGVGYYPEFLRESTAIADYYDPGLIVFGALEERTQKLLSDLNSDLPCQIHKVDLRTAEMVKYTSNSWRAVKVTFANEIGNIAKANGLDGQLVMGILCSDQKVNISSHFMRPGFAFGGSCLPKDVRALRQVARAKDVASPMLDAVIEANRAQIERAEAMVEMTDAATVGMVGISFKPGTDDLRESPLAELASRLIGRGIDVRVYDPFVNSAYAKDQAAAGRGNDFVPDLQSRLEPTIEGLIDRSEILLVGNRYSETLAPLNAAIGSRKLIDLARLDPNLTSNGQYQGICW